VLVSVVKN